MLRFTYKVTINALPAFGEKKVVETLTGELLAPDQAQAKTQAQSCVFARCKQLEKERGDIYGYENVQVELAQDKVITAQSEAKYPLVAFDHAGVLRLTPPQHKEEGTVLTPQDYMRCALRTLYPDLTTNERLGLCGLGLFGEIGEVADLLKKFLYHRNGKPLDVNKLKDELGDVLWYFFILLDTLGLTFEAVMRTSAIKLEERHPNGFNPHYQSDSHASEVEQ